MSENASESDRESLPAWETIGRETTYWAVACLLEEADATVLPIADTIYWGHDVSAEQVERMRQFAFEFEYAAEEYFARLCTSTTPWEDDSERSPSRLPTVSGTRDADQDQNTSGGESL